MEIYILLNKKDMLYHVQMETHIESKYKEDIPAYHSQAVAENEEYVLELMKECVEELKSNLPYRVLEHTEEDDFVNIQIRVSRRFNPAFMSTLSKLCEKFVENRMLAKWYESNNGNFKIFYDKAQFVMNDIKRIFIKVAPVYE